MGLEEARLPPTKGTSTFVTRPVSPCGAHFYSFDLEQSPCCLKSFPAITSPWQDSVRDTALAAANPSWETTVSSGVGPEDLSGLCGVALAMPKHARKSLFSWNPVSGCLLFAQFPPKCLNQKLLENDASNKLLFHFKDPKFSGNFIHLCVLRCSCINYSEPLKDNEVSVALCFISRVLQVKTNHIMPEPGFSEESPLS